MKYLINLVELSRETQPLWGTYIHICRSVRGSGASRQEILNLFNKLMGEDEYDKSEKKELIDYLVIQSKQHKDGKGEN